MIRTYNLLRFFFYEKKRVKIQNTTAKHTVSSFSIDYSKDVLNGSLLYCTAKPNQIGQRGNHFLVH